MQQPTSYHYPTVHACTAKINVSVYLFAGFIQMKLFTVSLSKAGVIILLLLGFITSCFSQFGMSNDCSF